MMIAFVYPASSSTERTTPIHGTSRSMKSEQSNQKSDGNERKPASELP